MNFFLDQWRNESHFMDARRIVSEFCDARACRAANENLNNDRKYVSTVFFSHAEDILFRLKLDSNYRFQSHSDSTVENVLILISE